jgi:hypothetical protein
MDFIINFLGANPYQAIAVPVIGGFTSGIAPQTPISRCHVNASKAS